MKKVFLYVNELLFIREVPLRYSLAFILPKKVDQGLEYDFTSNWSFFFLCLSDNQATSYLSWQVTYSLLKKKIKQTTFHLLLKLQKINKKQLAKFTCITLPMMA